MDTDILFEFCYIQEDVLKDRLAIFMRAISVMQNKAVELEADLDSRLDTPFRSGRDVIDGYWKLYTDICEAYNDISKYQYVSARLGYTNQYNTICDVLNYMKEYTAFYVCSLMESLSPSEIDPLMNPMKKRILAQNKQNAKDLRNSMIRLNSIRL